MDSNWRLSNTLHADFCVEALDEAIAKFGVPEIMNTDQGSQYTGHEWTGRLREAGVKISMEFEAVRRSRAIVQRTIEANKRAKPKGTFP